MRVPRSERILAYVILIVMAILVLVPVLAGSVTAFKPQIIWVSSPPTWIFEPTLENFEFVFFTRKGWLYLRNSLIISVGSVRSRPDSGRAGRLRLRPISLPQLEGADAMANLPAHDPAHCGRLALLCHVPVSGARIGHRLARYLPRSHHHLSDISFATSDLDDARYFAELPAAMEESAMVEGYTRLGALWRVVLPVVWPGIVATAILNFIFAWNEFFLALILAGNRTSTLPMTAGTYIVRTRVEWGNLFAVNLIIMVPVILLTIMLRRQLVKGLTFGILE